MLRGAIPENLHRLWAEEDALIKWADGIIASEPYLVEHVDLIEAYLDCIEAVRVAIPEGERHIALCGLHLRQFDSMSHALRAAMSGNYVGCVMYARGLVETEFLIDFLMEEAGRPEEWLSSDPGTAREKFGANSVRIALDKRDGFMERKRKKRFDMLSAMGCHPRPSGLDLKRDGTRAINVGPFKQAKVLEACIQELARAALSGSKRLLQYCRSEIPSGSKRSSRLALAAQRAFETHWPNNT